MHMNKEQVDEAFKALASINPPVPKPKKRFYILIRYKYEDDLLCFVMPTKERAKDVLEAIAEFSQDVDGSGCGHLFEFDYGLSAQDKAVISLLDILSVTIVNETPDRAVLA